MFNDKMQRLAHEKKSSKNHKTSHSRDNGSYTFFNSQSGDQRASNDPRTFVNLGVTSHYGSQAHSFQPELHPINMVPHTHLSQSFHQPPLSNDQWALPQMAAVSPRTKASDMSTGASFQEGQYLAQHHAGRNANSSYPNFQLLQTENTIRRSLSPASNNTANGMYRGQCSDCATCGKVRGFETPQPQLQQAGLPCYPVPQYFLNQFGQLVQVYPQNCFQPVFLAPTSPTRLAVNQALVPTQLSTLDASIHGDQTVAGRQGHSQWSPRSSRGVCRVAEYSPAPNNPQLMDDTMAACACQSCQSGDKQQTVLSQAHPIYHEHNQTHGLCSRRASGDYDQMDSAYAVAINQGSTTSTPILDVLTQQNYHSRHKTYTMLKPECVSGYTSRSHSQNQRQQQKAVVGQKTSQSPARSSQQWVAPLDPSYSHIHQQKLRLKKQKNKLPVRKSTSPVSPKFSKLKGKRKSGDGSFSKPKPRSGKDSQQNSPKAKSKFLVKHNKSQKISQVKTPHGNSGKQTTLGSNSKSMKSALQASQPRRWAEDRQVQPSSLWQESSETGTDLKPVSALTASTMAIPMNMNASVNLNQTQPMASRLESMAGNFHYALVEAQQQYGRGSMLDGNYAQSCASEFVVENPTDVSGLSCYDNRGALTTASVDRPRHQQVYRALSDEQEIVSGQSQQTTVPPQPQNVVIKIDSLRGNLQTSHPKTAHTTAQYLYPEPCIDDGNSSCDPSEMKEVPQVTRPTIQVNPREIFDQNKRLKTSPDGSVTRSKSPTVKSHKSLGKWSQYSKNSNGFSTFSQKPKTVQSGKSLTKSPKHQPQGPSQADILKQMQDEIANLKAINHELIDQVNCLKTTQGEQKQAIFERLEAVASCTSPPQRVLEAQITNKGPERPSQSDKLQNLSTNSPFNTTAHPLYLHDIVMSDQTGKLYECNQSLENVKAIGEVQGFNGMSLTSSVQGVDPAQSFENQPIQQSASRNSKKLGSGHQNTQSILSYSQTSQGTRVKTSLAVPSPAPQILEYVKSTDSTTPPRQPQVDVLQSVTQQTATPVANKSKSPVTFKANVKLDLLNHQKNNAYLYSRKLTQTTLGKFQPSRVSQISKSSKENVLPPSIPKKPAIDQKQMSKEPTGRASTAQKTPERKTFADMCTPGLNNSTSPQELTLNQRKNQQPEAEISGDGHDERPALNSTNDLVNFLIQVNKGKGVLENKGEDGSYGRGRDLPTGTGRHSPDSRDGHSSTASASMNQQDLAYKLTIAQATRSKNKAPGVGRPNRLNRQTPQSRKFQHSNDAVSPSPCKHSPVPTRPNPHPKSVLLDHASPKPVVYKSLREQGSLSAKKPAQGRTYVQQRTDSASQKKSRECTPTTLQALCRSESLLGQLVLQSKPKTKLQGGCLPPKQSDFGKRATGPPEKMPKFNPLSLKQGHINDHSSAGSISIKQTRNGNHQTTAPRSKGRVSNLKVPTPTRHPQATAAYLHQTIDQVPMSSQQRVKFKFAAKNARVRFDEPDLQSRKHSKPQLYSPRSNAIFVSDSAVTQRRFSGNEREQEMAELPLQLPGYGFKRTFNMSQTLSLDGCEESHEHTANDDISNVLSRGLVNQNRPVLRELNSQSLSVGSRGSRSSQRASHSPVPAKNPQQLSHQDRKAKQILEWQERVNQKVQQKEERRTSLQRQRKLMHKAIR